MPDLAFFTKLVQSQYHASGASLHPFAGALLSDQRALFQVHRADGSAWVLRAYQQDTPVPDWLIGCDATSTAAWLTSRAATLRYLADQHYPAPRIIATRAGASVGQADGWCTCMTSYIAGRVSDPTPAILAGMAAALGRLHRLGDDPVRMEHETGRSWWYAPIAIPAALQQYHALAADLPPAWRSTVDAFCATLRTIQSHQAELPRTIIHGDAWAGNAVQTDDQQVTLIDWEPSGQGLAILDLGRLLLYGHQDLSTSLATPITPAAWRVHAIVEGYCAERIPTASERAVLLDAIRFSVAFGAATHFASAQRDHWHDPQPERLTRRQHWFAVSAEIADLAQKRLDQLL